MNMLTGASPSRGTKEDLGSDGGAAFLTELKSINPKDFASQSPDGRASQKLLHTKDSQANMSPSPQPGFMNMTVPNSPVTSPQNMLVSFKFLTQVPIEEFVVQEHSRANKTSARLRSNASVKIERELQRKIKENY